MAVIPVDRADLGMVLAAAVTDRRGRMLIPAGKELDEKLLKALRMWGITTVDIEGAEPAEEDPFAEMPEELLAQAKAAVEKLFARNPEPHTLVKHLFQKAVLRHAERLVREGSPAGAPSSAPEEAVTHVG